MDCCNKKVIPDKFEGIDLSDKNLREKYGDPTKEPAVYGGIQITEDISKFLKLPVGFRTFSRMNIIQD